MNLAKQRPQTTHATRAPAYAVQNPAENNTIAWPAQDQRSSGGLFGSDGVGRSLDVDVPVREVEIDLSEPNARVSDLDDVRLFLERIGDAFGRTQKSVGVPSDDQVDPTDLFGEIHIAGFAAVANESKMAESDHGVALVISA